MKKSLPLGGSALITVALASCFFLRKKKEWLREFAVTEDIPGFETAGWNRSGWGRFEVSKPLGHWILIFSTFEILIAVIYIHLCFGYYRLEL